MTPIPLTAPMVIEPAASEAFSVLECDPGDAHLLSPKEKKSACNEAAQTKPEVGVLFMGLHLESSKSRIVPWSQTNQQQGQIQHRSYPQ